MEALSSCLPYAAFQAKHSEASNRDKRRGFFEGQTPAFSLRAFSSANSRQLTKMSLRQPLAANKPYDLE
jgi:hypothetical protein